MKIIQVQFLINLGLATKESSIFITSFKFVTKLTKVFLRHRHHGLKYSRNQEFLKWLHELEFIKIHLHAAFLNNGMRMKDRPNRDLSYRK